MLHTLITERNDIPQLLGMDWREKLNLTIRNIRFDEEHNQSEKRRVAKKFPDLLTHNILKKIPKFLYSNNRDTIR